MTTIVTRAGKGSSLTWTELDANFTNLNADKVEASDLADTDGSNLVGFLQAGTGATARTAEDKLQEIVSVKDFGAVGDGVTDDTAAITAAITYAKTLTCPHLVVPSGSYLISTLTFDLPNNSTLTCYGQFVTSTNSTAITIGAAGSNTFYLSVHGLSISRSSADSTGTSTGIQLLSLVASNIHIRKCTNFRLGVLCYGVSANGGFSYNHVVLGLLHDNRTNLRLSATGSGYCNENNFYGGSFNHSSGYAAVSTVNIDIVNFTSALNNNRFFGPSLEDNSTLGVAAEINGNNNVLFWPRLERSVNQSTYEIQFTANSTACAVLGAGFSLVNSNISDAGTGNLYETSEGLTRSYGTPDDAAKAALSLQSTATSTARLLRFLDSGGSVTGWVKGTGEASLTNLNLTNLGDYANDAAAAVGGVPVLGLYRNGSVLQIRVS